MSQPNNTTQCNITINSKPYAFNVSGNFAWGNNEVLYNETDDTISNMPWKKEGFSIIDIFTKEIFEDIYNACTNSVKKIIVSCGIAVDEKFNLENYHKYVTTDAMHASVVAKTVLITAEDIAFDIQTITTKIESVLQQKLTPIIPELNKPVLQIRISRPNSTDINPPHKDAYLSYYRKIINLWIPICGVTADASLPVIPESHTWPESDLYLTKPNNATIGNFTFRVPAIINAKKGLHMKRVTPLNGQALIFTPYLIHGSAVNFNKDVTRISLELRLSKSK
jgi:hypothetical protein